MRKLTTLVLFSLALSFGGCGGNPYGYARAYEPWGDEDGYLRRQVELSYEDVRRFPGRHAGDLIGWFGVVRELEAVDAASGEARIVLDLRPHQARHLCRDETPGSCRVTVSERGIGPFTAMVRLRPEELREGNERLWRGSLVKVYGHVMDPGTEESGPIVQAEWHRHWPHGTYVTTAARGSMRR